MKKEVQELWGSAWYASSATIAARFGLTDGPMQLGRQAFPRQADWLAYVGPHPRVANPQARRAHVFMLAKAKWFEAQGAAARLGKEVFFFSAADILHYYSRGAVLSRGQVRGEDKNILLHI